MTSTPEAVHRAFQDAFNRRDLEGLVALYEADAVLMGPGGPAQGHQEIRERYRAILAVPRVIDLQTAGATVVGDVAMLYGRWTLRGSTAEATPVDSEGCNTEVVRRQADGRWLFVIDYPSMPQA